MSFNEYPLALALLGTQLHITGTFTTTETHMTKIHKAKNLRGQKIGGQGLTQPRAKRQRGFLQALGGSCTPVATMRRSSPALGALNRRMKRGDAPKWLDVLIGLLPDGKGGFTPAYKRDERTGMILRNFRKR